MPSPSQYELYVLGPLRLLSSNGEDITPSGRKVQALLALLATPPGRVWSRSALQDKLWSDRDQVHGRDSLKKALATLRSTFAPGPANPLASSGRIVQLDPDLISVDLYNEQLRETHGGPDFRDFLEGCDVRDPEFEDWLTNYRSAIASSPPVSGTGARFSPEQSDAQERLRIALLPIASAADDLHASLLGDLIADRICIALRHQDLFDVCDFRACPVSDERRGADALMQLRLVRINQDVILSLSVREVVNHRILWADKRIVHVSLFGAEEVARLTCDFVDLLTDAILRPGALPDTQHRMAARYAMDAMDLMFRIDSPNLAKSSGALKAAIEIEPRGSYLALYAYQTLFRLEASKGTNTPELRERAEALICRALEADPYNPVARSLVAHVYSFLFRDFAKAEQMLGSMSASPPDSPFYFHALAALRVYTGRLDEAADAARKSAQIAQYNPYSYAFKTSICMVETMRGNFDRAIRHGEHVVSLHGNASRIYEPALRYLAAAYGHLRDRRNAGRVVDLILRQSPDFSLRKIQEKQYPIPSPRARDLILSGLSDLPSIQR